MGESGTPPSLHRYLYAYSNPTVYYDPNGHNVFANEVVKDVVTGSGKVGATAFKDGVVRAGATRTLTTAGKVAVGTVVTGDVVIVVMAVNEVLTSKPVGVGSMID